MSIPLAILSHGFFGTGGGSGIYTAASNVRFGIDRGDGVIGTLTLPVVGDVRRGTLYGGSGSEFTGTLWVRSSPIDSWTDDSEQLFYDMAAEPEWGQKLQFNGYEIDCIKTELSYAFEMRQSGYDKKIDCAFDCLRSEAIRIGLYLPAKNQAKPEIHVRSNPAATNAIRLQVQRLGDDNTTDAVIKLLCSQLT